MRPLLLAFVLLSGLLLGCAKRNQLQNQLSPDGRFVLSIPIEPSKSASPYHGHPVWRVTIKNVTGEIVYKDEDSLFSGVLNVYWGWDEHNRIWLYNSDDGRVWCWTFSGDNWSKTEASKAEGIPEYILPSYAKSHQ